MFSASIPAKTKELPEEQALINITAIVTTIKITAIH
jgi:hypothetical protein